MAGLKVGDFYEAEEPTGLKIGPGYDSRPGLRPYEDTWEDETAEMFNKKPRIGGGMFMAGQAMPQVTMEDMMNAQSVNQRAKMMQQLNRKVQQLRKMGMEPQQIDLLLRGQMGALKPDEEPAYMDVMRQLAMTQRVQGVPGLQKQLRSWPGQPGQPNGAAMRQQEMQRAMEGMGFGGGGMETMEDLMR